MVGSRSGRAYLFIRDRKPENETETCEWGLEKIAKIGVHYQAKIIPVQYEKYHG